MASAIRPVPCQLVSSASCRQAAELTAVNNNSIEHTVAGAYRPPSDAVVSPSPSTTPLSPLSPPLPPLLSSPPLPLVVCSASGFTAAAAAVSSLVLAASLPFVTLDAGHGVTGIASSLGIAVAHACEAPPPVALAASLAAVPPAHAAIPPHSHSPMCQVPALSDIVAALVLPAVPPVLVA
ncbi:hypothetical protein FRC12_023494, partial [Ceratobasidium sp. 428]